MIPVKENSNQNNLRALSEDRPQLSLVIPAYNEDGNLHQLYLELMKVLPGLNIPWEIIFVDDGSVDKTWEEIQILHQKDQSIKGIRFSRNFGHQYALFAGLSQATGDAVIMMDADLQHPPDLIPKLIDEWRNGNKIVHTVRLNPEDFTLFKKITAKLYYKIFSFLSGVKIENGMADFRLLDRQVVDTILHLKEGGLFLRGLVQWVGYQNSQVEFQCANRFSGQSKYNLGRMIKFAWSGISSFSVIPLRMGVLIGLLTSLLAFYQLGEALWTRLFTDRAVPGWASVIGLQSLLFGILFILLGILGEYLARILQEVRQRPRFIVSDAVGVLAKERNHSSTIMPPQPVSFVPKAQVVPGIILDHERLNTID